MAVILSQEFYVLADIDRVWIDLESRLALESSGEPAMGTREVAAFRNADHRIPHSGLQATSEKKELLP